MFGDRVLKNVMRQIENMTIDDYAQLLNESMHYRGFNGELSFAEMVERGYFDNPYECHGIYINAVYKHYKGKEYVVRNVVADCETCEPVVIYDALYENKVSRSWCRKKSSFMEILPNMVQRFTLKNPEVLRLNPETKKCE